MESRPSVLGSLLELLYLPSAVFTVVLYHSVDRG